MDPVPIPPSKDTFLSHLRLLDESMKNRVLIVSSVVMMLVVVYVWIGYFNSIVMGNSSENVDANANVSTAVQGQSQTPANIAITAPTGATQTNAGTGSSGTSANIPGFWSQVGSSFAAFYHGTINAVQDVGGSFNQPKEYNITPQ